MPNEFAVITETLGGFVNAKKSLLTSKRGWFVGWCYW